ncbi:chromosome segregation protein SMC [Actinomyces lilanjuaniae]|uniref:Chromosome segregation protein SMC n=1 Tax=Actinomyces lilanjuaniae TaxID=2321394 RepID=A0ABN5PPA6_9ACTO|nr:ATP-binding protein [Actinomyces lilanjuaniae]AYD90225.1 chromosome segregation protein SMC [Actinomyces lilanjuaniae]
MEKQGSDGEATSRISQLRLTAFKNFREVNVPLEKMTVLTGRNSSGKSNILDALDVLHRLTSAENLTDALDGRRREGGPVRSGAVGCAPHGSTRFSLGCTVTVTHPRGNYDYRYDVELETAPFTRVVSETLEGPQRAAKSGRWNQQILVSAGPGSGGIGLDAAVSTGKRGPNRHIVLRDDRSVLSQLPAVLLGATRADRDILDAQRDVAAALRSTFHFDPAPSLMRDWVPLRETQLRRTGENLAPVLRHLQDQAPGTFSRLEELARQIADCPIRALEFSSTDTGDIMIAVQEEHGDGQPGEPTALTTARSMSDGLLRFLAIATALSTPASDLDLDSVTATYTSDISVPSAGALLAVEEIENGLHPSNAGRLLHLVEEATQRGQVSALVTTHSPALLDALSGKQLRDVLVCHHQQVTRLVDLPGYAQAMSAGTLGTVVTRGLLDDAARPGPEPDYSDFLALIGAD